MNSKNIFLSISSVSISLNEKLSLKFILLFLSRILGLNLASTRAGLAMEVQGMLLFIVLLPPPKI